MRNILLKKYPQINYALIVRLSKDDTVREYVAAWWYQDNETWCQGHYFKDIEDALEFINSKKLERRN